MKITSISVECDIPGEHVGEVRQGVALSLDGEDKELDLCARHEEDLRAVIQAFAMFASSPSMPSAPRGRRNASQRRRAAEIRAWANEKGLITQPRGRIPADIVAQFREEHAGKPGG